MDGVTYTSASTSAFLTQCYCIFIPLVVALRERRWPKPFIILGSVMVMGGITILARFDWDQMRMGRGEQETILATVFFTAQILWLERPRFANNNPNHFSLVMFASMALILLPVPMLSDSSWHDALEAYRSGPALLFAGILTGFCTLGGYVLMNFWQPHIEASKAGLIYCAEPVFASLFALFLPEIFSSVAGIDYPNETWTSHLLMGGGLITGANVLIMLQTAKATKNQSRQEPQD
jgi:drug/metabolite transporter (DMT)-like permease